MSDWGVPNWRDASAYPSPSKDWHYWRWQFTRRCPDYREAWQQGDRKRVLVRFGYSFIEDPKNEKHTITSHGPIFQFLDLSDDDKTVIETVPLTGSSGRISNHFVKVPFDLDRPLPEQIKSAKAALKSLQSQLHGKHLQRRLHRDKWPLYLRVIDAREAGETLETIGRELLGLDPDAASEDLPVHEFDRKIDRSDNAAAAALQVWEQARYLMFNFPD